MLNLVQLQERLKDLPMQAIMQYANGANPQIPPFLALGELNRRKKMQENAAAEQAKEMAGAPSIKEQIEQATGLMALQGSRQRMAAQQQQSAQQQAMMPAPNTTTSEPAQLAGGGYIDEVPRDYQAGGRVDPMMLKKLMMMKAMQKRRPGISGLPVDMFKRQDYAGGGIVAFSNGGSTFDGFMAEEGETSEAPRAKVEVPPELYGKVGLSQIKDIEDGKYGRTREEILKSFGVSTGPRQPSTPQAAAPSRETRAAPSEPGLPSAVSTRTASRTSSSAPVGLDAVAKALGIDVEKAFPVTAPRKIDDIMAEQKRRQGLAGVSEDFLNEREKRLEAIEAQRAERRAKEPMDQLMEFLGGVAASRRGGTFGTQGAEGVAKSRALAAQQAALRDKQALEMEELRYLNAAKRDALRRGDLAGAEAIETQEKNLAKDMAKTQFEAKIKQGELASTAEYRRRSGDIEERRLTETGENARYDRAVVEANREAERVRKDLRDRLESGMDKALRDAVKKNPNYIEEQVEAARIAAMRRFNFAAPSGGAAPATTSNVVDFTKLPK
jgi:hypothetical protein